MGARGERGRGALYTAAVPASLPPPPRRALHTRHGTLGSAVFRAVGPARARISICDKEVFASMKRTGN